MQVKLTKRLSHGITMQGAYTWAKSLTDGSIAAGGGHLVLGLARKLAQRLLQKLDIGLQAAGAPLHLLFGGADLQPADVLRSGRTEQGSEQSGLLLASPKDALPDRFLFAFDATDYSGDEPGFARRAR
jgi:hypothetical protein